MTARMSAVQPDTEKSPCDAPVPRKLNAIENQPASRATRSASSGNVIAELAAPRGPLGKPWHSTSAGAGPPPGGLARCVLSRSPSERIDSSKAPVSSVP